jgi:predicted ester cyclase
MTTETQKMIERIPLEILNNNKFELIDELYSKDYVEHTPPPGVAPTREGFKQTAIALKTAFPDLRYTIEDVIESGDKIVHRLTASGTMKADFLGMPATGKHATWTEVHIGRVVNGPDRALGRHRQLSMLIQSASESPVRVPAASRRDDIASKPRQQRPGSACHVRCARPPRSASFLNTPAGRGQVKISNDTFGSYTQQLAADRALFDGQRCAA